MRTYSINKMLVPVILAAMPAMSVAQQTKSDALQRESAGRVVQQINHLVPTAAGQHATDRVPQQRPPVPQRPLFNYQPPNRGAPSQRVGGGTRSINQLSALAPAHVALTSHTQPRLYWFVTPGFRNKLRFRLSEAGIQPPLLEIQLPPQPDGGVHYLDLAMHDVHLEPGKLYDWGVILEPFPHQRIPPLVSRARVAVDDSYAIPANAPIGQKPYIAARQGYWYDALDWISRLISGDAGNAELYHQRADLLEQGGLMSAALYERETGGSNY